MLWYEQIKEKLFFWVSKFSASAETRTRGLWARFFHPESPRSIRRLQFFWLGCGGLGIVAFAYVITTFLFETTPHPNQKKEFKVEATSIETVPKKVNLDDVFRHKIEGELQNLSNQVKGLETLVLEGIKQEAPLPLNEESEAQPLDPTLSKDQLTQELQNKIAHLEEQVARNSSNSFPTQAQCPQLGQEESGTLIQKTSLSLTENPGLKPPKTVDTTIPAGAFAKTVLLSGLDASSAMTASSDPRPMLLRLIDHGTLPRRFQSDLKDCHCTAGAYGDLSSERVYARLEKLTCIERKTGGIIEIQVSGYIAGSDGKAGIRGVVASKDGQFLARSLMGGIFAGLSNVANPQHYQMTPFFGGSGGFGNGSLGTHAPSPPGVGEMFASGMAKGATTALDRLSQYYIDRAEQLQPVIQVDAGQVVDIVFTEGVAFSAQYSVSSVQKERKK
ncbi:MAG: hypothetical protein A2X70_02245 [Alphaproteobacteria bacterium GWC2_42_16]|nr:MAG: hypothetical protein A2X70_02245 [Alphaproteobacteria bacterium GWC2_42_16]OFW73141.1 MAG: hypothetical protein A2Z80_00900 [Alphaproteobacteria bacterium GWA2_41_27]OFW81689.1 MAG: hypothetical protein A3E50_01815 [Alphaproteobacteria bacterium RIFCSPHIGHO2_12_FULL_42_100]OFW86407.1 MAG: hypothetical protein A2W06_05735 [Alphaproteobacteria bacterium RBG_16_42_14]OFW90589.1 MAG: hypothetical protein A3C41_00225 [Alphaproteobacteria bacterium RIFCSPHIGHO2_02_FULL_42_30]OFX07367.1 MAG: 